MDIDLDEILESEDARDISDEDIVDAMASEGLREEDAEEALTFSSEDADALLAAFKAGLIDSDGNLIGDSRKAPEAVAVKAQSPDGKGVAVEAVKVSEAKPSEAKPSGGSKGSPMDAAKKRRLEARPVAVGKAKGAKGLKSAYIKVTASKGKRANVGPDSSAPSVAWKVQVIDPKTGEPLKVWKNAKQGFLTLEGHPMSNYLHLLHDVVPYLEGKGYSLEDGSLAVNEKAKAGGILRPHFVTEYDSTSAGEKRANRVEDAALRKFGEAIRELRSDGGEDAEKVADSLEILFNSDYLASDDSSPVRLAPWQVIRQFLEGAGFNYDSRGSLLLPGDKDIPEDIRGALAKSQLHKAVRYLVSEFGFGAAQARKLIESSGVLTELAPEMYDKVLGRRAAEDYWGELFNDALNLTGNLQPMFGHMLLDSKDSDLPGMIAFRNGERSDQIDWDKFYNTVGPVGRFIRVHPYQDMPFLSEYSPEVKALLKRHTDKKSGKVDLAGLDADLVNLNNEIYDYAKYVPGEGEEKRESGSNYVTLADSSGKKVFIPIWDLFKKYESTMVPSLGENWAKYIRGTGGYGFGGDVASHRLNPDSDIAVNQYNPVLKNLYALAVDEAPWLADVLRSYYLNYGEQPFVPDIAQLATLIRQIGNKATTSLDFLLGEHEPGKSDSVTGLTSRNFGNIADATFNAFFRADPDSKLDGVPYIDVLNNITGGAFSPVEVTDNHGRKRKSVKLGGDFRDMLFGVKGIKDPLTLEERPLLLDSNVAVDPETGRLVNTVISPKTGESRTVRVADLKQSDRWRQAVMRAVMRRVLSNPELGTRMLDPAGGRHKVSPLDARALRNRQRYVQKGEELFKENGMDPGEDSLLFDPLIDRAGDETRRLAVLALVDLLKKPKTVDFKPGVGLVDDLSAFLKPYTPSDKRVKRPVRKGRKPAASIGRLLDAVSSSLDGNTVSDADAKEPSDWASWEARRKALVGGGF